MPVKNFATAIIVAMAGQSCLAAPGMIHSAAAPAQPSGQGFWSKLWRGDDQPAPQPSAVAPSTAAAENARAWWSPRVGSTAAGASGLDRVQGAAKPGVVSLQNPTGDLSPKAWVVKAQLAEMQQDYAGARQCFSQALQKAPNDAATLREIGHFEDRREQLGLAEQMYRRALATSPRNPALLNDLALCCARQGRLTESAQLLGSAVSLRPEKTLYRNNIAKVLIELGEPAAAESHLAAVHPAGAAKYNLGQLLAAKGEVEAAAVCFRDAVRIDPTLTAAATSLQSLGPAVGMQVASAPQSTVDPEPVRRSQSVAVQEVQTGPEADAFKLLPPIRE
ncbi:Tetratricopeptide repeat protein [Posidoniimonas polymericola]|uniref:Tetratricopeptide repeat protein n=1 Tax=Posidoniimonas polymericola TaxID=2528002 RepID=A0A5C5YPL9_9BACT|nr:tetratricopeptide repeat protein [Posidoniimonas polymericola]TWT76845.1 Tetratricopeptide repeat protein [Posidoniimonas polymericola]